MNTKANIARNMEKYRLQKGWTYKELALEAGLSCQTIYRLKKGAHKFRLGTMIKLAKALDVTVTKLEKTPE